MQKYSSPNGVTKRFVELYGRRNLAEFNRYADVLTNFRQYFGYGSAFLCSSPGRVEFIGNHLDHNGGRVIACTVNLDIVAAFHANNSDVITIMGKKRGAIRVPVGDFSVTSHSAGLVKGVVRFLSEQGFKVGGFDAYTDSVIPSGAGVSSSAAFELFVGSALSVLYNNGAIPSDVLARAGQFAENVYFGKPCGLLDQSVIATGGAVLSDFRDGVVCTRLEAAAENVSLVLINTGKSHSDLSDLYAAIPADMRDVARFFGAERLVNVPRQQFFSRYNDVVNALGEGKALRAKHFFDESERVERISVLLNVAASADKGTLDPLGSGKDRVEQIISLINASGDSSLYQLKNCSTDESDSVIADAVSFARGVCLCGARVHGGGFAGTVLCVLPSENLALFVSAATEKYGADNVYPLRLRPLGTTVL